jgi:putative transposase
MSFIDAHDFPAGLVLRVLNVPESTYYDWRARKVSPSRRELDDAALLEQIVKIRAAHEFACGCQKVVARLATC